MELQHRHDDGIGLVHCGLCSSPSHVGENELNITSVGISVWSKCAPKCSIPLGSKWDKWYPMKSVLCHKDNYYSNYNYTNVYW